MWRSLFAGSALAAAIIVVVPVLGGTGVDTASVVSAQAGTASAAPVITAADVRHEAERAIDGFGARAGDQHIVIVADRVAATLEAAAKKDAEDATDTESASDASGDADKAGSSSEKASTGSPSGSSAASTGGSAQPAPAASSSSTKPAAKPAAQPAAKPAAKPDAAPKPAPAAPKPAPKPEAPKCPAAIGGGTSGAPGIGKPYGYGTTSDDLNSFAQTFNQIRVANCLPPVPFGNIRYDSCMEQRLFWMAEDPSTDPMSAWGHIGSKRSDGVASVGCDGNLAGGNGNTGSSVAQKWWDSSGHRASLYQPGNTGSMANVCILFAMTHGGVPNEPASFTRAAARWVNC